MFWKNFGLIILFLVGVLIVVMLWLRWYTNHGQALTLPDYVDYHIKDAANDADKKSFEIEVVDSVFLVGKEGGVIIDQNPKGGSKVKEHRKIYATITKYQADQIPLRRLPVLYGKNYERKKRELTQGFEINTKVVGRRFDAGAPDHILEVLYKGKTVVSSNTRKEDAMIEKGGTLEVVLSKSSGGAIDMPDLHCASLEEAKFLLQTFNLKIAESVDDGTVDNVDGAYIWKQEPGAGSRIYTGESVKIYLTQRKPSDCND